MARSSGSGVLSFGLVTVPFKLHPVASRKSVAFRRLHKRCNSTLGEQLLTKGDDAGTLATQRVCPADHVVVEHSDTIRGFEYARDQYVLFTDAELRAMKVERNGALTIEEFVPETSVDSLVVRASHFIAPDTGADRGYRLMSATMQREGVVGVGRIARRGKESVVIVRPYKGALLMQECFYADELRSFESIDTGGTFDFKPVELDLAERLIEQMRSDRFDPARYRDHWADRVGEAVARRLAGEEIVTTPDQPKAQIIDLLERLKETVKASEERVPANHNGNARPKSRKGRKGLRLDAGGERDGA